MATYNDDKVRRAQQQADDVANITRQNIQMSLDNVERLETMETKADQLQSHAQDFHRGAVKLRRRFCWENYRILLMLLVLLAIVGVIIYGIIKSRS